jgi:hypothetical protein
MVKHRRRIKWIRGNVARGTSKGWMFGKRCRAQLECNNSIRNQGLKERLQGSRRTLHKTFKQSVGLEIMKLIVGFPVRI